LAKTKVFTITVQNQPGAVAAIAKALGSAKVNILALSGTAEGAAGTVRLVAEEAKRARKVLDKAKLAYQETGAEQHELLNKPGALAQHLEKLAAKGVTLSSIHATAVKGAKKAVVVYTVEAPAKASEPPAAAPAT
jgi:hypothetical protein